jgi:hypothetical protein
MHNIDWRTVLTSIAADVSVALDLSIIVGNYILEEIDDRIHVQR